MALLRVGTSGFSYPHWVEKFYPKKLPSREWLGFYAAKFDTVELNVTFYRLPTARAFVNWHAVTPPQFCFALKGSRFITHIKRLKNVAEPLRLFLKRAQGLEEKLGVILWQFSSNFSADPELLASFGSLLRGGTEAGKLRHAFEFRHRSWFEPEIISILREHNLALCIADAPSWPCTEEVTADFVYLRFHGSRSLYSSCYTEGELRAWVNKIRFWMDQSRDVYAYFNNDACGYAVDNALELKNMV